MMNSVNRIFFRRSGILNALTNALSTAAPITGTPDLPRTSVHRASRRRPPAASILAFAAAENACAFTVSALVDLAPAEHLDRAALAREPVRESASGVTSAVEVRREHARC